MFEELLYCYQRHVYEYRLIDVEFLDQILNIERNECLDQYSVYFPRQNASYDLFDDPIAVFLDGFVLLFHASI